jgi:hypothetical protein
MSTRLFLALFGVLLLVRLPSLVQPMGADQGLYAYVGERILHGDLAYRDAWDQKPPGIHYVYAALRAVSSHDAAVPAADLLAAALVAICLWRIGTWLAGPAAGCASGVLYLALSDPSFARYGGVRVRGQCETFIALLVSAALVMIVSDRRRAHAAVHVVAAGVLIGAALALKYNAGVHAVVILAALALVRGLTARDAGRFVLGAALVPLALGLVFALGGALRDLYDATITYNVRYSGETYASRLDMIRYALTFPVQHARVDALWFVGGIGSAVLVYAGVRRRALWLPVVWVAASCLEIAVNGSRNLPQYFVQAAPALGLAAGVGGVVAFRPLSWRWRTLIVALLGVAVWRVNDFPKLASNVAHDLSYITGRIDRRTHLARYGGQREIDKYSALDNMDLGSMLAQTTRADDTVLVFGFSPGAYVYAHRRSASRFFWSRPVIAGFKAEDPRYGVAGLLADLQRNPPARVVLQNHDWFPDVTDSAPFFLAQPALRQWLESQYHEVPVIEGFRAWERNAR